MSGGQRPSGLRNPGAAMRGVGAAALVVEALVLLLAIQPLRILGGSLRGAAIAAIVVCAVAAILLAALLRHVWAWYAAAALQVIIMLGGLLHWSLVVLGAVFGAVWAYLLYVRRRVLGKP